MISPRSPEILKKEHDLQAEQTVCINLELQRNREVAPEYYLDRVTDMAVFANILREVASEDMLVVLHSRPEIMLSIETEEFSSKLFISDNCWRFYVNGSVDQSLEEGEKFGPSRALKKLWDTVIPKLPEGFIIRGRSSMEDSPELKAERDTLRQKLGLGALQPTGDLFGIIRNGTVMPMNLDEFLSLTKVTPGDLSQKFAVRKVTWAGA